MRLREYVTMDEMTKLKKVQKMELMDFILNVLTNVETARILKKVKQTTTDTITISKKDAEVILNNLLKIRKFILDIPIEDEEDKVKQ